LDGKEDNDALYEMVEFDGEEDNDALYEMMVDEDDKINNDALYEMADEEDKIKEPDTSMMFSSWEELHSNYKKYAKRAGFAVVKRGIKKEGGCVNYRILACSRQGKPRKGRSDGIKAVPKVIKTECKARICAMLSADGIWFLSKVVLEHNHDLSPSKARFFRCHKNIDSSAKKRLVLNDRSGIRTNKNFKSLVVEMGGYENLPFGEKRLSKCY
jgi:hypothetical protein